MATFLGTLVIVIVCCLAMGIGLLFAGRPFRGGCGGKPAGAPRCEGCPQRDRNRPGHDNHEGES